MMFRLFQYLLILLLPNVFFAQTQPVAFIHVNVVDVEKGKILLDHMVIVDEGEIAYIGPTEEERVNRELMVINGKSKYLVPGIAEMHAHIPVARNGNDTLVKETLFLYLSNGITTIRGMLGNPYHLELQEMVAGESILSPRIITSSPSLNGNTIPDVKTAISKVRSYKNDGYDFLKLHPGIKLDVFESLVETAKDVDIPFSGHVSTLVGINNALKAQYASIDHLDGFLEGLVPASAEVDIQKGGFFGFNFTDQVDLGRLKELAEYTARQGVWVVPTQSLFTRWISPEPPAKMMLANEMQYISPRTRYAWSQSKTTMLNNPEYSEEKYRKFLFIRQAIMRALHQAGVGFLLGSDAPQVMNVPGFSIQHEMQSMVDAGIPPRDVLLAGTRNPAIFFGHTGKFGEITSGAIADLILIEGNPLEDIANMAKISGVMVRGRWLNKEFIDSQLETIAKKYER